jgi:GGDEF domain-containing protein
VLALAGRDDIPLAVALIDLDEFKQVNDRLPRQARFA